MSMKKKSLLGLFSVGNHWILMYPSQSEDIEYEEEVFENADQGIIELLYTIKECCLGHNNSKHNEYNIEIKRVKVKK